MCLMDAGVPLKAPVAGIAMGLVKEGEKVGILTDIMGTEDHYGDMDFKVAGTEAGITGLQMDNKVAGVSGQILAEALRQAREARKYVLSRMREAIDSPREELSPFAPRFVTIRIKPEKIREVIEKRMFSQVEDLLPVISFGAKKDGETEKKHEEFVSRMVARGYTARQVRRLVEWYMRVKKSG